MADGGRSFGGQTELIAWAMQVEPAFGAAALRTFRSAPWPLIQPQEFGEEDDWSLSVSTKLLLDQRLAEP